MAYSSEDQFSPSVSREKWYGICNGPKSTLGIHNTPT